MIRKIVFFILFTTSVFANEDHCTYRTEQVKENGKIVYATCSILPSENEHQINSFLKSEEGQDFKLEEEKKISPLTSGFDGFYMARLSLK